jgi:hypothetical protein
MDRMSEVVPLGESWVHGIVVASVALGIFSMVIIWWFPITAFLSGAGLALGLVGLVRRIRGPQREGFALGGVVLCGISLSCSLFYVYGWPYFTVAFAY